VKLTGLTLYGRGELISCAGSLDGEQMNPRTPLFTNTAGNNSFYFFDPASTKLPGRFYRATLP